MPTQEGVMVLILCVCVCVCVSSKVEVNELSAIYIYKKIKKFCELKKREYRDGVESEETR